MEKPKEKAKIWLCIAIVCMIISMVGASLVQTSGGTVKIKDLHFETHTGALMSGLLFVPPNATADHPAPAVVTSHGMYNSREVQDITYVELARRGYVVLSMDMLGHGWSESDPSPATSSNGMYEAVQMMSTLDYVDKSKIGVTGHSMGGFSVDSAILADDKAKNPLIAAAFYVASRPTLKDSKTNQYIDIYGSRDMGVLADQYDEAFWRQTNADGSKTVPRDFIKTTDGQSILNHGVDVAVKGLQYRDANTIYHDTIDGKDAIRVVYTPPLTHRETHFSTISSAMMTDFFQASFGAPNPIPSGNQIWPLKQAFNCLGLIGFFLFLCSLCLVLIKTPQFSSLGEAEAVEPLPVGKRGRLVFFGTLIFGALVSALSYFPILFNVGVWVTNNKLITQSMPFQIASWALFNAVVSIIVMILVHKFYFKKNGISLADRGLTISLKKLGKTLALGVIVVAVTYATVFFADYFFKTDFRVWIFDIKAFPSQVFLWAIPTFIFLLIYYVVMSVSMNCFNYNTIGKKKWVNTALLAASYIVGPLVLYITQYATLFLTGEDAFVRGVVENPPMYIMWLIPTIPVLVIAAVISRKIYRRTGNPYLGGFINAAVITLITCSNCQTLLIR